MALAVSRIAKAVERGEKILIYGDYDVDGMTGTALLLEMFQALNYPVDYYIPHRIDEGYGLHSSVLNSIRSSGVSLVITSDCGTTSHTEIIEAARQGLDIIVTDHHQPSPRRPQAVALLNPFFSVKRPYPFLGLSSVGVAFKLAQAVFSRFAIPGTRLRPLLDLVALGTVADVAPLVSENRYFVKEGLAMIREESRPGLRALLQAAKIRPESADEQTIRFYLAPRLNAAGRLYHASAAISLLTAGSSQEAGQAADQLDRYNQERQQIELKMWLEAERQLQGYSETASAIVVASEEWHPGVVGIIASRIVERTGRPAVAIAFSPDGTGRGSGRSFGPFDLHQALSVCGHRLDRFGGHPGAVGLTIRKDQVGLFRRDLEEALSVSSCADLPNDLSIDAGVELEEVSFQLVKEINALSPFGEANPEPVLSVHHVQLISCKRESGRVQFKIRKEGGLTFDVRGADRLFLDEGAVHDGIKIDLAFTPEIVLREGEERIVLKLRAIRPSRESSGIDRADEMKGNTGSVFASRLMVSDAQ